MGAPEAHFGALEQAYGHHWRLQTSPVPSKYEKKRRAGWELVFSSMFRRFFIKFGMSDLAPIELGLQRERRFQKIAFFPDTSSQASFLGAFWSPK